MPFAPMTSQPIGMTEKQKFRSCGDIPAGLRFFVKLLVMSNKDDFAAKKAEAQTIKGDDVQVPYMPVGVYAQEAEDLAHWAKGDKEQLIAVGLSEELLNEIPTRAGALREAQSRWMEEMRSRGC